MDQVKDFASIGTHVAAQIIVVSHSAELGFSMAIKQQMCHCLCNEPRAIESRKCTTEDCDCLADTSGLHDCIQHFHTICAESLLQKATHILRLGIGSRLGSALVSSRTIVQQDEVHQMLRCGHKSNLREVL